MKKIICLMLSLIIILGLTGCFTLQSPSRSATGETDQKKDNSADISQESDDSPKSEDENYQKSDSLAHDSPQADEGMLFIQNYDGCEDDMERGVCPYLYLFNDGSFEFKVNLLEVMGYAYGTYEEYYREGIGQVLELYVEERTFGEGWSGYDIETFYFVQDGEAYIYDHSEGVGNTVNGASFLFYGLELPEPR